MKSRRLVPVVVLLVALSLATLAASPSRTSRAGGLLGGLFAWLTGATRPVAARPPGGAAVLQPATLDDCLAQSNHGACVNCCKALGESSNDCARFCWSILKGGPPEPVPEPVP